MLQHMSCSVSDILLVLHCILLLAGTAADIQCCAVGQHQCVYDADADLRRHPLRDCSRRLVGGTTRVPASVCVCVFVGRTGGVSVVVVSGACFARSLVATVWQPSSRGLFAALDVRVLWSGLASGRPCVWVFTCADARATASACVWCPDQHCQAQRTCVIRTLWDDLS